MSADAGRRRGANGGQAPAADSSTASGAPVVDRAGGGERARRRRDLEANHRALRASGALATPCACCRDLWDAPR